MTGPDDRIATAQPAAPDPAQEVFRTALRTMWWLLGSLTVLGVGVGYAVDGGRGVWGAVIGVGLAALFSGTTVISMLRTAGSTPTTMAAVILGAWLGKVVILIAVLAVIRDRDFYSKAVLAVVLLLGVVGSAVLDYLAVRGGRVPYVTPSDDGQRQV